MSADLIGHTLGGYQIVEQIGKGGMAMVYKAYQPSLDRDVAVKILPAYYADQDESFLKRFKREARAIAKLRHPNILMVMDYGEQGEIPYLVMEYVPAGTLKDRLGKPLPLDEMVMLLDQIAKALDYAHSEGVVHRDVKPSNVLMPKPDWALLTDFGLAKMVGGSFMTQSGMTVGTPAYMSPEQGRGEKVDHRSDIYSLGIILYEMATGGVPYTAETPMAVVVKHIVEPLPMPMDKNPELPEDVQRIILKALAKDPADRFQKAGEIVEALIKVQAGQPTEINIQPSDSMVQAAVDAEAPTMPPAPVPLPAAAEPSTPPPMPVTESGEAEAAPVQPVEATAAATVAAGLEEIAEKPLGKARRAKQPKEKRGKKRGCLWAVIGVLALIGALTVAGVLLRGIFADQSELAGTIEQFQEEQDYEGMAMAAKLALDNGHEDEAFYVIEEILDEDPSQIGMIPPLAESVHADGNVQLAIEVLELGKPYLLEPNPMFTETLGWWYLEVEEPEDALDNFEEALAAFPDHEGAALGYTESLMRLEEPDEALTFLERFTREHPRSLETWSMLGDMYASRNQLDQALDTYIHALEIEGNDPWLHLGIAQVFGEMNNPQAEREHLEMALENGRRDGDVLESVAYGFQQLGDFERAVELFRRALELDPDLSWSYLGLAETLIQMETPKEQVFTLLEKAAQHAGEDPYMFNSIGWAYAELGNCPQAIKAFERAVEIEPLMDEAFEGIDMCKERPDAE
ncbi:MAG: protein kinase [Anaerolineales bacterium]|nr:protein kinase [Anaerolineales bacterium]